jgi:phosphopantetheinyl transferase
MTIHAACLPLSGATNLTAEWLTDTDRLYVANRVPTVAAASLAARAALRALLAHATGRRDWIVDHDTAGKPFVHTGDNIAGPAVSVSHSGDMAAVAVGPTGIRLGIDIERHRARDVLLPIAKRWFGPGEIAAVESAGAIAFYRIWTAREALGKAIGTGLEAALTKGDAAGPGVDTGTWSQSGLFFRHSRPVPGYSLTVATDAPPPPIADIVLPGTGGSR